MKGPLENIVASLAYAWRAPVAPYFLPCRSRFISHCERSRSKPTPSPSRSDGGDRDGSNPIPKRKKQRTPNWAAEIAVKLNKGLLGKAALNVFK